MNEKGLTAINIRSINQNKLYQAIFHAGSTSKLQLVQTLEMGLSTVSQNLKQLEAAGLITRDGLFESTGGRKAHIIRIIPTARIAIGVGILKNMVHLTAIDLYGNILCKETIPLFFTPEDSYYCAVGDHIQSFIQKNTLNQNAILGVSIAVQGIVSRDGLRVEYGVLMSNESMELASFKKHIPFPCRLEHDSKAAAVLEQWTHPDVRNAVVLLLNRNMGGAIISDCVVQTGDHMRSGLIEHICIQPDGPECYCGHHGCLETLCSAERLESQAGMNADDFFHALRGGKSAELLDIWASYLEHLAFAMRNLNTLFDCTFILSGYLAPYFLENDIADLMSRINAHTAFPLLREQIMIGTQGQYAPAVGGALNYIKDFLASV